MEGEETDQNESADTTCLMHRNASFKIGDLREKRLGYENWNGPGTLGPVLVSWVIPDEIDDDVEIPWLECNSCGKRCTNRDEFDSHTTSCEMSESGVMDPSQVTGSYSLPILNTEKCDKSTSTGTEENVVEVSRATVSSPNNGSISSGLEMDREGNGVVHNLSMECSKATTSSHVPRQTIYEIENVEGEPLGVAYDDGVVEEGMPLPGTENAFPSKEESKILKVNLSRNLSWFPCQFCGTFLPNQAKLEFHIAFQHYSPNIFDDTFDDRDKAGEEKDVEESEVKSVVEEDNLFEHDDVRMTMTPLFQFETYHDVVFSEDDYDTPLRSCGPNLKGLEEPRMLEEEEDEDWFGALNFGVARDETEDSNQSLIGKEILTPNVELDKVGEEENYSERNDTQIILSESRPDQNSEKSQKINENLCNGKTRGKRGILAGVKEPCTRRSERLLKRLAVPEKGEISIGLMKQKSESQNQLPSSSLSRKSRGKQVLLSKQNEENSHEKDETDVVEKKNSSIPIRKCRNATSINVKSRESRTRKSNKGVNKVSPKNGNSAAGKRRNKTHQCTECFKWFKGKFNLDVHMRIHTGERPFECVICFVKFSRKENLKRHQLVHDTNKDKPFECDTCGRQFFHKRNLKAHRQLHTHVLPLKCRFCPRRFGHKSRLIPHERRHKGARPFKCDQCSSTFTRKTNLNRHLFFHTGARPFQCNICNREFQTKGNLRNHQATHSDELPFKCTTCPKRYRTKYDLSYHEQTHFTERQFKCDLCPRSFIRMRELNDHKHIHTGDRPHTCDVCSKSFRVKSALIHHKKLHDPTSQFQCDVCSKTFKLKKYLNVHKKTHSSAKPFMCDTCGNIFKTLSTLRKHRKKRCVRREEKSEEPTSSSSSTN